MDRETTELHPSSQADLMEGEYYVRFEGRVCRRVADGSDEFYDPMNQLDSAMELATKILKDDDRGALSVTWYGAKFVAAITYFGRHYTISNSRLAAAITLAVAAVRDGLYDEYVHSFHDPALGLESEQSVGHSTPDDDYFPF